MSLLETWVQTPGAAALGWTLVHSMWEGAVLALALAVLLCFLRSSRARYAAACLAMCGLVGALGLTFTRVAPQRVQRITLTALDKIPRAAEGIGLEEWAAKSHRQPGVAAYLPWIAPFWMAGVLVFHLRNLTCWMAARRLRRTGVCCAPDPWQLRLDRLGARLRLSRPITLLESGLADVPVVIGYIRPVILMPVGLLAGLPAGQVEAILLHELAHIRRHDYVVNLLQIFIEGLVFYHPAVWWISGVIRAERENCCDDLVVAVKGGAYEYAMALTALEQSRGEPRAALAATGGSLAKRIRRLLAQPERKTATLTPVFTAAILTVTVVTAMAAWQSRPADRAGFGPVEFPPAQPSVGLLAQEKQALQPFLPSREVSSHRARKLRTELETPSTQLPVTLMAQVKPEPIPLTDSQRRQREEKLRKELESPYKKWLNEDVLYIITDEEKQAWKRLAADEEREQFIELFWQSRNRNPSTPENKFKEEHYRRIGYANERFATANLLPGWKTDRGRIYITYGPPDEIETHASGGAYQRPPEQGGGVTSTVPFERWRYRRIEGVGNDVIVEFVDPAMTGEFRMTMDPSEKEAERYISGAGPVLAQPPASAGQTGATVQLMGKSAALISFPLTAYGDHRVNVYARLTKLSRTVVVFEETIPGPNLIYTKFMAVSPGSYRLNLVVKDVTTGKMATDTIEFEVK